MSLLIDINRNLRNGLSSSGRAIRSASHFFYNAIAAFGTTLSNTASRIGRSISEARAKSYRDFQAATQRTSLYLGLKNSVIPEQSPSFAIQTLQSTAHVLARYLFIDPFYRMNASTRYARHLVFDAHYNKSIRQDDRDNDSVKNFSWGQTILFYVLTTLSPLSLLVNIIIYTPTAIALLLGVSHYGWKSVKANFASANDWLYPEDIAPANTRDWTDVLNGGVLGIASSFLALGYAATFGLLGFTSEGLQVAFALNQLGENLNVAQLNDLSWNKFKNPENKPFLHYILKTGVIGVLGGSILLSFGIIRSMLGFNDYGFTGIRANIASMSAWLWERDQNHAQKNRKWFDFVRGGLLTWASAISTIALSAAFSFMGLTAQALRITKAAREFNNYLNNDTELSVELKRPNESYLTAALKTGLFGVAGMIFLGGWGITRAIIGLNHRSFAHVALSWAWVYNNDETHATEENLIEVSALSNELERKEILAQATPINDDTANTPTVTATPKTPLYKTGLIGIVFGSGLSSVCYYACKSLGLTPAGYKVLEHAYDKAYDWNHEPEPQTKTLDPAFSARDIWNGGVAGVFGGIIILTAGGVSRLVGFNPLGLNALKLVIQWQNSINDDGPEPTQAEEESLVYHFAKGGLLGWAIGGVIGAVGIINRGLVGFNSHGYRTATMAWNFLTNEPHNSPFIETARNGGALGIIALILAGFCKLTGISPEGMNNSKAALQWANLYLFDITSPIETRDFWKGSIVGLTLALAVGSSAIVLGLLGLSKESFHVIEAGFQLMKNALSIFEKNDRKWDKFAWPTKGKTPLNYLLKTGVLGASLFIVQSTLGTLIASALVLGISFNGWQGVMAGAKLGSEYLTTSMFDKNHPGIQYKGGVITYVAAGLSIVIAGGLGLIANNQSVALFYYLRNFFTETKKESTDSQTKLPLLTNVSLKNSEAWVKQLNVASFFMSALFAASIGVYAAATVAAFVARIVFYRVIYQGMLRQGHSPENYATPLDELGNYRDYLIINPVTDDMTKQNLDDYKQEKKSILSALKQDSSRAYRLGTSDVPEKIIQEVMVYLKKQHSINATFCNAFSTLQANELGWSSDGTLVYSGENSELKTCFNSLKITLEMLGTTSAKTPEITKTLKHIGLFGTSSKTDSLQQLNFFASSSM